MKHDDVFCLFLDWFSLWNGASCFSEGQRMTPEQEENNRLLELVSSLASLTQNQANMINELLHQNGELLAQLKMYECIGKAQG